MERKRRRKPGGGRKRKPAELRRSAIVRARVDTDLYEQLELEAVKAKRSLSREIYHRLKQSMSLRDIERERYLAILVTRIASWVQRFTNASWREDRYTFEAFWAGITYALNHPLVAPKGPLGPPLRLEPGIISGLPHRDLTPKDLGEGVAVELLKQIMGAMSGPAEWHQDDQPIAGQKLGIRKQRKEPTK